MPAIPTFAAKRQYTMSFFNFRKSGSGKGHINDPETLLKVLRDTHAEKAMDQFRALCKGHRDLIFKHFPSWAVVPYDLRNDQLAVNAYAQTLIDMATLFARAGDDSLIEILRGGGDNPLDRWDEAFRLFEGEMKKFDFAEARNILQDVVDEMRDLKGPGVDMRKPYVHERLAWLFFLTGDYESAELHGRTALQGFEKIGNVEGLLAISRRLADIFKAAGDREDFVYWITTHTNILIQTGHEENATAIRRLNGISPLEGIIDVSEK